MGTIERKRFFYPLYIMGSKENSQKFIGTAFPVSPNGGLLTCRHVVDVSLEQGEFIAVHDVENDKFVRVGDVRYPIHGNNDIAYLHNALGREKKEFFPIIEPPKLLVGTDVYTHGFFSLGGSDESIEQGYFGGKIVNFSEGASETMKLPFAVIDGMSGSPILTYHNGVKLAGLAFGNHTAYVVAHTVVDVDRENEPFTETIHRVVELGRAYHPSIIVNFLHEVDVDGFIVASGRVELPGLE